MLCGLGLLPLLSGSLGFGGACVDVGRAQIRGENPTNGGGLHARSRMAATQGRVRTRRARTRSAPLGCERVRVLRCAAGARALPGNVMDWHVRRAPWRTRRTSRAGPGVVGGRRRRQSSKRSSIVVELAAQNSIKPSFSSRSHILWPLGSRFCASRRILTSLRGRVESTRDRELAVRQIPARIGQGTVERAPKGRGNPPSLAFSRGGAGQAGVLGAVERERGG